ncbi:MAG: winged helix-turn-helix domain-containing protein [Bacillota bacterium]
MNTTKILIIEDDGNIRKLLALYLKREGFKVLTASSGQEGLDLFFSEAPDLVILDIMLPDIDGWEICRRIRHKDTCPVIMLTALDSTRDKVAGLELGSDDYITKPFEPREMIARVRAVLRRSSDTVRGPILKFPDLTIDQKAHRVIRCGEEIHLTAREFDLLWLLANHPGQVFTRDQLLDRVWGYEFYGNIRTVDVHIRHLREKMEPDPDHPRYIKTVWGVGYKFEEIDRQ